MDRASSGARLLPHRTLGSPQRAGRVPPAACHGLGNSEYTFGQPQSRGLIERPEEPSARLALQGRPENGKGAPRRLDGMEHRIRILGWWALPAGLLKLYYQGHAAVAGSLGLPAKSRRRSANPRISTTWSDRTP